MSMAMYEAADRLYTAFNEVAEDAHVDDIPVRVFKGSIVERWGSLSVSQGYYSAVMQLLKDQGCITVIASGRRARPSVIALHHPPDEVEFLFSTDSPLTGSPESAKLRLRLESLEKRVGGVNIAEMLIELDKRVSRLEHLVGKDKSFTPNTTTQKEQ